MQLLNYHILIKYCLKLTIAAVTISSERKIFQDSSKYLFNSQKTFTKPKIRNVYMADPGIDRQRGAEFQEFIYHSWHT